MSRASIVPARRLASLLLGILLVLSCTPRKVVGPNENRGPTATITRVPSGPILEGTEVTFDASSSSDPEGDTLSYVWNVGDSVARTGSNTSRTYVDEGSYDVTLIVTDPNGASDTAATQVAVENAAPVVGGMVGPDGSIAVGNSTAVRVWASDPGTSDVLTMQIDWKDGTTSTLDYEPDQQEAIAAHRYSTIGTYAVELTVQDNDGGITRRTIEKPIVVVASNGTNENRAPTARITSNRSNPILEGATVAFDARSSSDPDGDTLTYRWNIGYPVEGIHGFITHRYIDEGSYQTMVIVTDEHGASDTATTEVLVQNVAPSIRQIVTPAGSITLGTSTAIRISASDPGDDSLTLLIDWKDGDSSTVVYEYEYPPAWVTSSPLVTVEHQYSTAGNYAVEVTVQDNDGGVTKQVVEKPIVVLGPHQNHPPVARITGPASGGEGAGLLFSSASSSDPDGDSLTVTWLSGGGSGRPYPTTVDHQAWLWTSPDNGTYLVAVIVADDSGAADTASMSVTISNMPPTVSWFSTPAHEAAGDSGSIQVVVGDPGTADRQTITVDWGDGTAQTVADADSIWDPWDGFHTVGSTLFHTYATTGTYSITATARDDDGGVSNTIVSSPVRVFDANQRQTVAGYEAVDLGTLGGNAARPADINNRGQIVGTSLNGLWAERAVLWDETGIHDLGTLGHEGSEAVRINDAGVIAGTVWTRWRGTLDDNMVSTNIATIWQNGVGRADSTHTRLVAGFHQPAYHGRLVYEPPRIVRAINGSGDVAWTSYGEYSVRGWLSRNGSWQSLPTAMWGASYPFALNDRGQVVGATTIEDGWVFHATLWEGGSSRALAVLEPRPCPNAQCSTGLAMDINENGHIVGLSTDAAGRYHFVLWVDDSIRDLGPADWTNTERGPRIVMNDRGDIAGSVAGKAFFWNADTMISLPSAGGSAEVVAMNANGDVIGTVTTGAEQRVFVWSVSRGLIDLGTGPHGFNAAWVVDINDRGDILGYTGPCCRNSLVPYGLRWSQVRPILWRNTQATASR